MEREYEPCILKSVRNWWKVEDEAPALTVAQHISTVAITPELTPSLEDALSLVVVALVPILTHLDHIQIGVQIVENDHAVDLDLLSKPYDQFQGIHE